jgi:dihydrofolate reductase
MSSRTLAVTENVTLDGVIDATDDWFAPGDTDADADMTDVLDEVRRQREAADALLLGRVTFEELRGYWPLRNDDTTGIADYLDDVTKYVVSSTLGGPEWQHTTVLRGDLVDEIRDLKARPGLDIVTTGSITLVHALVAAALVDEYRLFVYPVVVGRGRRLFADGSTVPRLRLTESRGFRSGIVLLRYLAP